MEFKDQMSPGKTIGSHAERYVQAATLRPPHQRGRNPMKLMGRSIRLTLVLATLLGVSDMRGPVVIAAQTPAKAKAKSNNLYIVQMSELPVVSYTGGTPGFRAT